METDIVLKYHQLSKLKFILLIFNNLNIKQISII